MRVESLAGQWFEELHWGKKDEPPAPELRLGTELVSFEQDETGVRVVLRDEHGDQALEADRGRAQQPRP